MPRNDFEEHLDVYNNRYELHQADGTTVFYEGFQNTATQARYNTINSTLADGYLEGLIAGLQDCDYSDLSDENKRLLKNMVNGITSEAGRALVGLTFLQLTIKSITPEQSIRLHKGATRNGSFSWVDGISMRTIDSMYNTPFLREHGLLNLNKYGLFMTRSLAENYPYSRLYKAEMRGPFNDWIAIVDSIEEGRMHSKQGLCYLMSLLKNRSEQFNSLAKHACDLTAKYRATTFNDIVALIRRFFSETEYSARAFEVAMHSLLQAMNELHLLGSSELVPLSQMRSANKKHGNVGDIELTENRRISEAWDAKYGKPYLRDELEELYDKLQTYPDVGMAGFVVDTAVDARRDIIRRANEISSFTGTEIHLFSFSEWVEFETQRIPVQYMRQLPYQWLVAMVESFAQMRPDIAPIDEPCDEWITDLIRIME